MRLPVLAACIVLASSALAQERDDLEKLVGQWSIENGASLKIAPSPLGWEAWVEDIGRTSLVLDSTAGSHVRLSTSKKDVITDCFYTIDMLDGGARMNWRLRKGPADICPKSGKYEHMDSGKSRAEEIAEVRMFRNRINKLVAAAEGADMTGIEVIYWERSADNERVKVALELAHIPFELRGSSSPTLSNVITCQRDVPIEATKHLARKLIEAKVPIRAIRPTQYQQFRKRLTVESLDGWMPGRPLLTLAQIDGLTSCNLGNKDGRDLVEPVSASVAAPRAPAAPPIPNGPIYTPAAVPAAPAVTVTLGAAPPIPVSVGSKVAITFDTGLCPDTYNVTAKFWSPALNAWQMTHLKGISGQETFKNADDTLVTTSTRDIYFAVRNLRTNQFSKLAGDPVVWPGSDTTYYKRGPNLRLNCGG
jgi:hypothetical protein